MTINAAPTPLYRVRKALNGREPDRVPVFDICSEEHTAISAVKSLRTTPESAICLLSADLTPRYPVQVLDRDGGITVQTTPYGGVCRVSVNDAGPPEMVDYAVKSRTDWVFLARRLEVAPDRADWDVLMPAYQRARAAGLCVAFAAPMGFEACAMYSGARNVQEMMGADPGFVRDMAEAHAGLLNGMADVLLTGGCDLDVVLLFDDLADRRGPHFPSDRYREIFAPAYRSLTDFLHGRGVKVIVYSGGDIRLLVPDLVVTGVDCLGPLEVAAGMDLRILKLNYGADLAFLGGIDRRALRDRVILEREVASKVSAGMVNGRYIAGFDGPLPAHVPAEQYVHAAELLAKYGKY
jgi:uroporphyrinogen decarboxylase